MAELQDILKNLNKIKVNDLLKRIDVVIYIIFLSLGLLFSNQIVKAQKKKITAIKEEIVVEEQKILLGKELVSVDNDVLLIIKDYLKKDSAQIINFLQQSALEAGVRIVSLNPDKSKENSYIEVALFNLVLEAEYKNLCKFISLLELQKDLVQIESISIKSRLLQSRIQDANNDDSNLLLVNMVISTTFMKER